MKNRYKNHYTLNKKNHFERLCINFMFVVYFLFEKNCFYIKNFLSSKSFLRIFVLSFSYFSSCFSFSFLSSKASKALIQIMISEDLIRFSKALSFLIIRFLLPSKAISLLIRIIESIQPQRL